MQFHVGTGPRPHDTLNASCLCLPYTELYPLLRSLPCKTLSLFLFLSILEQTRLFIGLFFSSRWASSLSFITAEDAVIDSSLSWIPKPQLVPKQWKPGTCQPSRRSFCVVLSEIPPYQYWLVPHQDMYSSPVAHISVVTEQPFNNHPFSSEIRGNWTKCDTFELISDSHSQCYQRGRSSLNSG